MARDKGLKRAVALVQAAEYIATGVLPLVSMRTFEAVTGPKVDCWLVKTLGVLVTVGGVAIGLAALRRRITPEIALLGAGSAADWARSMWYSLHGRISRSISPMRLCRRRS